MNSRDKATVMLDRVAESGALRGPVGALLRASLPIARAQMPEDPVQLDALLLGVAGQVLSTVSDDLLEVIADRTVGEIVADFKATQEAADADPSE